MRARFLARTLAFILVCAAALGPTVSPAATLIDPTGDPLTSERTPAPASLRPFGDIVELDGALSGSTVEARVRVAGHGPSPVTFLANVSVDTTPADSYPAFDLFVEAHGATATYAVHPYRSLTRVCSGVANFDGTSTYTARFDTGCIGSPTAVRMGVTTTVPYLEDGPYWLDQAFGADVVATAVQPEPRPTWTAANASYAGSSRLRPDAALRPGQYLLADDVGTVLVLRRNGNLALFGRGGRPRWSSGTAGQGAVRAKMQGDGNLVLYRSDGRAVWSSGTFGNPGARLTVQRDGNAVIYGSEGRPLWSTGTSAPVDLVAVGSNRLCPGDRLQPGQFLRSADGRHALVLRSDGDLVVYGPGHHALWAAGTRGLPVLEAVVQTDGNVVIYLTDGRPAWSSGTAGQPSRQLVVQDDGNLVLYGPASRPLWWSGTQGRL